jgi:hypothetical protein
MGVISVKGPQFGQSYSVNIFGDTPTPEEQSRINQFVTDQELIMAQRIEERFGTPTEEIVEEAPIPEDDEDTAIGGFARGVGRGFASSFAQIPQGIVGLGESLSGREAGSTRVGEIAQTRS